MATSASSAAAVGEFSAAYPGWRVVAAANLGVMVSFGSLLVFTFGVFLKPLAAEFGWSREEISRAFAIAAMTVAASSPFLGQALDRFGPRRVILPCFAVFAAAVFSLSGLSGNLWQLYAIFFAIGLVGNATTQMGYAGAVSSWFAKRRGLALACVMAGVGVGSIVHPILAQWCIGRFGWRAAYAALGALVVVFAFPLTSLWVRRNPASAASVESKAGVSFGDALRQREFWILAAVLFFSSLTVNGALTHLAAHLSDRGLSPDNAALATGLLGGANLAGRLAAGWFLDRVFGPRLCMALMSAMAAGILILSQASSLPVAAAAAILIGIGLGGEADITPFLLTRYFGLKSFSALYGLTWTFYALAGALGPVVFGRVFDTTGSYAVLLGFASALTFAAACLMLGMRRYRA